MSPLGLGEISRSSVDILLVDGEYPVEYYENLPLPIQMQLYEKRKFFLKFLVYFWNLYENSNIFNKKMIVIANVFPKLQTVKNFVRPLFKKRRFGTRFDTQHDKVSQVLEKSPWERFYHVFSSFWERFVWNISPVLLGEILEIFLNTLSTDGKYLIEDWENLPLPIEMQFSEKWKTFSQFLAPFMDSASNFKHFEEKDDGHS